MADNPETAWLLDRAKPPTGWSMTERSAPTPLLRVCSETPTRRAASTIVRPKAMIPSAAPSLLLISSAVCVFLTMSHPPVLSSVLTSDKGRFPEAGHSGNADCALYSRNAAFQPAYTECECSLGCGRQLFKTSLLCCIDGSCLVTGCGAFPSPTFGLKTPAPVPNPVRAPP